MALTGISHAMEGEDPVDHRYYIPFAENTFSGDWQFRLEVGPRSNTAYHVSILGYDRDGDQVVAFNPLTAYGPFHVFTWETAPSMFDKRLQSIVVVSDQELDGVLWMWNDVLGVVNGVSITNTLSDRLIMPHIPSNFFSWRSNFAVMGVSHNNLPGRVSFGYSNNRSFFEDAGSWVLEPNAHLLRTPFYSILLSDADTVTWGDVSVETPDFQIAGFQSFLKIINDDSGIDVQSAALELGQEPVSEGTFLLSQHENWTFTEMFAFTNPGLETVRIDYQLTYREPGSEKISTAIQTESIGSMARVNKIIGTSSLFPEIQGEYLALRYRSYIGNPDDKVTAPIYATHLQSGDNVISLGAHAAVGNKGNAGSTWITFDERFETLLDVSAFGEDAATVDMVISDRNGQSMLVRQFKLAGGEKVSFLSGQLSTLIEESLQLEGPPTGAFRIDFSGNGNFVTKSTLFRGDDFAVVNPPIWFAKPEF